MIIADTHIHSLFSHDGGSDSTVDNNCLSAIEKGIKYIAFTEHYDVDMIKNSKARLFDLDGYRAAVSAAKEKYEKSLVVLYGIELGDPIKAPECSKMLTEGEDFDFVIGSIHAPRNEFDFMSMCYDRSENELIRIFEEYLEDEIKMIKWSTDRTAHHIDTVAHLTYPYRYFLQNNKGSLINLHKDYLEAYSEIMRWCIERGVAVECNSSGLRQNIGELLPNETLLRRYKELGGELVTAGSDSHFPKDVGRGLEDAYEALRTIGFRYVTVYEKRKPIHIKL